MDHDADLLEKLEESTRNATRLQAQILHSVIQHNGGVRYLRPFLHSYPAPIDAATFRAAVPLSRYDDYADHIDRLADGAAAAGEDGEDRPLLSVDPLVCFFYSSGTTSMKPKLIPYFNSPLSKAASHLAHNGSDAILRRLFPPSATVNKNLWFLYAGNVTTTKGGCKAMAASSLPLHRSNATPSLFDSLVSPREVLLGSNVRQQMYCHLLCGLSQFHLIDGIRAPYAVGLIKAFSLLESKWEQLCEDLECGIPGLEISDVSMRDAVGEVLGGARPDISKRIRSICEEQEWGGILGRLWPNARYVRCVTTGSMEQYYHKLKYYAAKLPVLGGDYFASECPIAINLNIMQPPQLTRFVVLPSAAYFEFLPYDLNNNNIVGEKTSDFSSVEVGKTYEVVATTYRGFYRYHLGDIVRVVGFHNSSPEVEFVMRAPKNSTEIITERGLMSAMETFQLVLKDIAGAEVVEFACFCDSDSCPKQLKIFVETKKRSVYLLEEKSVQALKRCCSSLESDLPGLYSVMRKRKEVGPLLLYIVEPGSFDRLQQVAIENGAPASQYKPPKIIRNREISDFLEKSSAVSISPDSNDV